MQRPVMNPTFLEDTPVERKLPGRWKAMIWRSLKLFGRALTFSPFGRRANFRNEEGTKLGRFVRGLTYRLAFVPLLLVAFLVALVFATTHPGRSTNHSGLDPLSFGVYYDPVNFVSEDGARLDGWLVPVIDAKRVLEEREAVLGKRYPAVVLLHDLAGSRQQFLPQIQSFHEAGFVVLAMNLRGTASATGEAQTFGIKEAMDIKSAVEMLRRRAFVDPSKIALVGVGSGANAALIALRNDPTLTAAVLVAPVDGFDQAFAARIGADRSWLPPLRPLFRWTFQVMYGVDASDLEMINFAKLMETRHILTVDGQHGLLDSVTMRSVQGFLEKHLGDSVATTQ